VELEIYKLRNPGFRLPPRAKDINESSSVMILPWYPLARGEKEFSNVRKKGGRLVEVVGYVGGDGGKGES
jgi:hypothetical protein